MELHKRKMNFEKTKVEIMKKIKEMLVWCIKERNNEAFLEFSKYLTKNMFDEMDLIKLIVKKGTTQMAQFLLDMGFNINTTNKGIPLVAHAIRNTKAKEMISFFIENGVNINCSWIEVYNEKVMSLHY